MSELRAVRELVQTVVDETYGGLWAAPPLPIEEEDWSQSFVAVLGDRIVGMALTDHDWVSDLWVLREFRGLGVGGSLLAQAEAEIVERGYKTLRLRVVKSNAVAMRFYLRHGWRAEQELANEKFPITMLVMGKWLER